MGTRRCRPLEATSHDVADVFSEALAGVPETDRKSDLAPGRRCRRTPLQSLLHQVGRERPTKVGRKPVVGLVASFTPASESTVTTEVPGLVLAIQVKK